MRSSSPNRPRGRGSSVQSAALLVTFTFGFVLCAGTTAAQPRDSAAALGQPTPPEGETPSVSDTTGPSTPRRVLAPEADPPPGYATPEDRVEDRIPPPPGRGYQSTRSYPTGRDVADSDVRVPSRLATRLRVLDADFAYLAARGGSRIVDGILSIVTGGLSITLGVIIDEPNLSEYLYVYGGAGVARGIVDLVLNPNASSAAIDFSHRPMSNMAEIRQRLEFGESELESLADTSRLSRILSASINIAAGVAFVPLYLGPNDFEVDTFGAIVLVTAGVSVVTGVINLFTRTEAERRWSAYEELRDRLATNSESEENADRMTSDALSNSLDIDMDVALAPNGAVLGLSGRF